MSKRLTIEEAEARHPDLVKDQVWVNNGTGPNAVRYRYLCPVHGEYLQLFVDHDHGSRCSKCFNAWNTRERLTIKDLEGRTPDLVKGQVYAGTHSWYWYSCPNHGKYTLSFDHRDSGRGCQKCAEITRRKLKSLTIEVAEKRCPDMVRGQDWIGNAGRYWFLCNEKHGRYLQMFSDHYNNKAGCPRCKESHGETRVAEILDSLNIPFLTQFRISECRNKRPLPFDFDVWIDGDLHLIEFHGEQHYSSRLFFGMKKFRQQRTSDHIKKNFCKKNKIPLLIIPYWEKDIEGKIRRFLGIKDRK